MPFAGLFRVAGAILIIVGILPLFGLLPMLVSRQSSGIAGDFATGVLIEIVWFAYFLVLGMFTIAFAELIQLFMDIESNTRPRVMTP